MSDYEQAVCIPFRVQYPAACGGRRGSGLAPRLIPFISYAWKGDPRNSLSANRRIRRVVRGSSMRDDVLALCCSAPSAQLPEDPGLSRRRHGFRVVIHLEEH